VRRRHDDEQRPPATTPSPGEPPPGEWGERERQLADEAAARARLRRRAAPALPDTRETVGAVVVTFNDEAHVALALRPLVREVARVVVCDLGSKDRTRAVVATRFPEVAVHAMPLEAGFAAAVNEGARRLSQPYLLVLHGDARLRPEALERLLGQLLRDRCGCVGPRVVGPDGTVELSAGFRPTAWRRFRSWWREHMPMRRESARRKARPRRLARLAPSVLTEIDWVSSVAMLLRRDALEAVGGMDEAYFLELADVDLCLRLRRSGWTVSYEPRARVLHLDRVAESRPSKRRSRRRYARRHGLVARLLRR
jgi:GT2 family glycosyltransferase